MLWDSLRRKANGRARCARMRDEDLPAYLPRRAAEQRKEGDEDQRHVTEGALLADNNAFNQDCGRRLVRLVSNTVS
jgi:hypothetical protein